MEGHPAADLRRVRRGPRDADRGGRDLLRPPRPGAVADGAGLALRPLHRSGVARPAHGPARGLRPGRRARHRPRAAAAARRARTDQARADLARRLRHRAVERELGGEGDVRGDERRLRRGGEAELPPADPRHPRLHAGVASPPILAPRSGFSSSFRSSCSSSASGPSPSGPPASAASSSWSRC